MLNMRIDKFLNTVNIVKRRAISEDMIKSGVVYINDVLAKPSKAVKVGDIISIKYITRTDNFEVLQIPELKNIAKSEQDKYIKKLENEE